MAIHCRRLPSKLSHLPHSILSTRQLRHLLHLLQKPNSSHPLRHLSGSCISAALLKLMPCLSTNLNLIPCRNLRPRRQDDKQILPLSLLSDQDTTTTFTHLQLVIQAQPLTHPLKAPSSKSTTLSLKRIHLSRPVLLHLCKPPLAPEHLYFHSAFPKSTHSLTFPAIQHDASSAICKKVATRARCRFSHEHSSSCQCRSATQDS